jgi:hypothetical protein
MKLAFMIVTFPPTAIADVSRNSTGQSYHVNTEVVTRKPKSMHLFGQPGMAREDGTGRRWIKETSLGRKEEKGVARASRLPHALLWCRLTFERLRAALFEFAFDMVVIPEAMLVLLGQVDHLNTHPPFPTSGGAESEALDCNNAALEAERIASIALSSELFSSASSSSSLPLECPGSLE